MIFVFRIDSRFSNLILRTNSYVILTELKEMRVRFDLDQVLLKNFNCLSFTLPSVTYLVLRMFL
jgi:hypothetical protein